MLPAPHRCQHAPIMQVADCRVLTAHHHSNASPAWPTCLCLLIGQPCLTTGGLLQGDVDNARQLFERCLAEADQNKELWDSYLEVCHMRSMTSAHESTLHCCYFCSGTHSERLDLRHTRGFWSA